MYLKMIKLLCQTRVLWSFNVRGFSNPERKFLEIEYLGSMLYNEKIIHQEATWEEEISLLKDTLNSSWDEDILKP